MEEARVNISEVPFRIRRDAEKAAKEIIDDIKVSLAAYTAHTNPGPFPFEGNLYFPTNVWKIKDLHISEEKIIMVVTLVLLWTSEIGGFTINPLGQPGQLEGFGPNYNFPCLLTREFILGTVTSSLKPNQIAVRVEDTMSTPPVLLEMLKDRLPKLEWISQTDPFL